MGRRRAAIAGRAAQLAVIDRALPAGGTGGRLVLVHGAPGIGKSAVLSTVADAWRRKPARVVELSPCGEGSDAFGLVQLVESVRDQFERVGNADVLDATGRLGVAVATLARAEDGGPTPLLRAMVALAGLARALAAGGRTLVLVDDADAIAAPALILRTIATAGCHVLAAVGNRPPAASVARIADTVVDLPPLDADGVSALLAQRFGRPADEGVVTALATALGPRAGHPATILSTVDSLEQAGRLVPSRGRPRGHVCLVGPQRPIALAADDPLVAQVHRLGPVARRLATAVSVLELGIDDIAHLAEATLGDPGEYGRTLDELVEAGVVRLEEGGLRLTCPALGARLAGEAGPTAIARLHRACAAALLRRAGHGQPTDRGVLADYLTAAGETLPATGRIATGLAEVARTVVDRQPERAARLLRAAMRHAAAQPTASEDVLDRLLRVLVRTGRYDWLAEIVSTVVAGEGFVAMGDRQRLDLAAAAFLSTLHTGRSVDAAAGRALGGDQIAALELARWWCDPFNRPRGLSGRGQRRHRPLAPERPAGLLTMNEVAALRAALRRPGGNVTAPPRLPDDVLLAASMGDLVTVLGRLLGPRYGPPTGGSLAAQHRLVAAYRRGDGRGVLSAARELDVAEPTEATVTPVAILARFLTAQAHGLRGERGPARQCLDGVPRTPPLLGLWWWATADADPVTERVALLREGVHALRSAPGGGLGVELTLLRMAELAAWADNAEHAGAVELIDQALAAGRSGGFGLTEPLTVLVQAVIADDAATAAAAVAAVHAEDDRPRLASACLVAAGVAAGVGTDPRPWLLQAHEVARSMDAAALRTRVGALLRTYGGPAARQRDEPLAFSAVETQIVELIRRGWTNRQIAARIRMSEKTVETYLSRLFSRTGCRSRVELATVRLSPGGPE